MSAGSRASWVVLMAVRLGIGLALVFLLVPVSIDDAFRTFHALIWWEHPSFYALPHWPPGYFWLYGLAAGACSDGLVVPRLLTLALHMGTGLVLAADSSLTRQVRWIAAVWLLLSPLALVLGTVPLSESLFVLLAVSGLVCLNRFLTSACPVALAASASLYLAAATVRYEGWLLLALFTAFSSLQRPKKISAAIAWALRLLPLAFPVVWMLLLWRLEADGLLFLKNIGTDSFGRGSLLASFHSPLSWVIGMQAVAVAAALIVSLRQRPPLRAVMWELHLILAIMFLASALITRNVPSQYTIRLLYLPLVFAAVPAGRLLASAVPERRLAHAAALAGLVLAVTGTAYALTLEPGHDRAGHAAAMKVREAYASSLLESTDHVLVDMVPPGTASVVVYANRPRTVHHDVPHATTFFTCRRTGLPPWIERTRLAVVVREDHAAHLESAGWKIWTISPPYTLYVRPEGAPAPGSCP